MNGSWADASVARRGRLLMALAFAFGICGFGGAAHAETDFAPPALTITLRGDVPARCKISPPQLVGSATNATFATNQSGGQFDITNLVDASTSRTVETHAVLELPIVCSGAHTLTVSSINGGLVNTEVTGHAGGFATRADYSLSASRGGVTKQVQTNGEPTSLDLSTSEPAAGVLSINFDLPASAGPLQAGAYSDEIVVQLKAAA